MSISVLQNELLRNNLPGLKCLMFGILLVLLSGCSDDNEIQESVQTPIAVDAQYALSVEPIFYRSCVACHVNAGIAPFSLKREENGYNNAVLFKSAIKQQLIAKLMPPFLVTNDGSCQKFQHELEISDAEIGEVTQWVDNLSLDTIVDVTDPPPLAKVKASIDSPDLVIKMSEFYRVNANLRDDYRCFVVDPGLSSDMLLSGYEVVPGNSGIVHHVVLFNLTDANSVGALEQQDANAPGLGYSCFGDADFSPTTMVAGWAPGLGATFYPQNTGIRLTANSRLIMQVHYNTDNANGNYDDQTQIKLRLSLAGTANVTEAYTFLQYVSGFQLDASNNTVSQQIKLSNILPANTPKLRLYGMFPHMHNYGKQITVTKQSLAGDQCLVNVSHWDFEWQRYYFYDSQQADVIIDPQNDTISINCSYAIPATDAAGNPVTVNEGSGSGDEMCLNFYYITPLL